jgi:hypothetical protein
MRVVQIRGVLMFVRDFLVIVRVAVCSRNHRIVDVIVVCVVVSVLVFVHRHLVSVYVTVLKYAPIIIITRAMTNETVTDCRNTTNDNAVPTKGAIA